MSEAPEELPQPPDAKSKAAREIMSMRVGGDIEPVVPRTLEETFRFAQLVCNAGLAPDSYNSKMQVTRKGDRGDLVTMEDRPDPQKVVIGLLTALELGVPPLQGLSGIAIIGGRACVWGDLAVGLVQGRGDLVKHEVVWTGDEGKDNRTCTFLAWRRGQENPYEGKFSIADAKRASLWNNPKKETWVKFPERMLFNRARAFAMRDGFADALKGVPIAEEYRDHATETQGPKPISTSFLDDERPAIEHQQAEAPNAFPKDEQPPSEILARGLDALTRTAPKDVEDLRLTIVNELVAAKMPEREFAIWHNSCDARASEK